MEMLVPSKRVKLSIFGRALLGVVISSTRAWTSGALSALSPSGGFATDAGASLRVAPSAGGAARAAGSAPRGGGAGAPGRGAAAAGRVAAGGREGGAGGRVSGGGGGGVG